MKHKYLFIADGSNIPCKTEALARKMLKDYVQNTCPCTTASIVDDYEDEDIFGNTRTRRCLVTQFTPSIPDPCTSKTRTRIIDCYDIRLTHALYCLQVWDQENRVWRNDSLANTVEDLLEKAEKYD